MQAIQYPVIFVLPLSLRLLLLLLLLHPLTPGGACWMPSGDGEGENPRRVGGGGTSEGQLHVTKIVITFGSHEASSLF